MVPTMNSFEILWPHKQLTDQIQKAKEIQRHTLSRRPLCHFYRPNPTVTIILIKVIQFTN